MLPTREQLILHLSDKMTNQDIANIYGTSFQKVIQTPSRLISVATSRCSLFDKSLATLPLL
ncbi:UNVERIFIED_ORG: DNA-directed RNA polymerase specialized sigma subunit [Peribacillus simplex]